MAKKRRYSEAVALPDTFLVGETKNGHPQLEFKLRIVDSADKSRIGEEVRHYQIVMMSNDDSITWAVEMMRAAGMTNRDIFKPEGLGSIKVSLCEEYETYEGNSSWRSKYINPLKVRESISGDSADAFSAALEAAFGNAPPVERTAANAAPDELPHATDFPPPGEDQQKDIWD